MKLAETVSGGGGELIGRVERGREGAGRGPCNADAVGGCRGSVAPAGEGVLRAARGNDGANRDGMGRAGGPAEGSGAAVRRAVHGEGDAGVGRTGAHRHRDQRSPAERDALAGGGVQGVVGERESDGGRAAGLGREADVQVAACAGREREGRGAIRGQLALGKVGRADGQAGRDGGQRLVADVGERRGLRAIGRIGGRV